MLIKCDESGKAFPLRPQLAAGLEGLGRVKGAATSNGQTSRNLIYSRVGPPKTGQQRAPVSHASVQRANNGPVILHFRHVKRFTQSRPGISRNSLKAAVVLHSPPIAEAQPPSNARHGCPAVARINRLTAHWGYSTETCRVKTDTLDQSAKPARIRSVLRERPRKAATQRLFLMPPPSIRQYRHSDTSVPFSPTLGALDLAETPLKVAAAPYSGLHSLKCRPTLSNAQFGCWLSLTSGARKALSAPEQPEMAAML
ncbi:hypothetical protein Purlil1_13122 [Purpureocillium lilacinum]|uniref:Uncharacterized protein n=1 Tax=Purpureocillium lilacinum TaxID=33203 RepID=A0ABR0BF48_PURLI|nr:hypothetical protein Purlil1_13122 [Purpureocillium lilacinum]